MTTSHKNRLDLHELMQMIYPFGLTYAIYTQSEF
jgi:hypothetical protein